MKLNILVKAVLNLLGSKGKALVVAIEKVNPTDVALVEALLLEKGGKVGSQIVDILNLIFS